MSKTKAAGLDRFAAYLKQAVANAGSFKPEAYYCPDSDSVEYLFKNDGHYGVWVTPQLTLYYSHEDNSLVGFFLGRIGAKKKLRSAFASSGGRKGGIARAKSLTASKRRAIAKKAAKARWSR